jgi:hypothetical protein
MLNRAIAWAYSLDLRLGKGEKPYRECDADCQLVPLPHEDEE